MTIKEIDMPQPQVLATDLVIGESARWHNGRLWLSNWGAAEILTFDEDPVLHRLAIQRSAAHHRWARAAAAASRAGRLACRSCRPDRPARRAQRNRDRRPRHRLCRRWR